MGKPIEKKCSGQTISLRNEQWDLVRDEAKKYRDNSISAVIQDVIDYWEKNYDRQS